MRFKGAHFAKDIILTCVCWYVAYRLCYRQIEEIMPERGVAVDRSTVNSWVVKYSPRLKAMFRRRRRPVSRSRRMDESYIRVHGQWRYLYRAVDKTGQAIDFLLPMQRDQEAALRFLKKAISRHGVPETMIINGSEANAAASRHYNAWHGTAMVMRQVRYLNDSAEQDHRAVKRIVRSTTGAVIQPYDRIYLLGDLNLDDANLWHGPRLLR
jgi:transposase-like protein